MAWLSGLFNLVGSGIGAFFGFKKEQSQAVQSAIKVVADVNASNAQREQAVATIIAAEAGSGFWLAACWRPLLMVFFAGLIAARWFGFSPEGLSEAEVMEIYGLVKLGIMGYIPARTIEKIVSSVNVGRALNRFIEKKLG